MGGQACVLYGAAEFSRDTDIAILAEDRNFNRLLAAMAELRAECIAVPPPDLRYLERGHAIHFRCHHPEADGMRVDVMSRMRGVDEFPRLWERRTTITLDPDSPIDVLSLADLVQAKKTQRDKDWPMIRRLLEADYFRRDEEVTAARLGLWLEELRTPEILIEVSRDHPEAASERAAIRPLLHTAMAGDRAALEIQLREEEAAERERDRIYWEPLRRELEVLRRGP